MHPSPSDASPGEIPFSLCSDGVRVRVRVAPKAARDGIHGTCREVDGGLALKVSLTAPAEGGKANAALVRMLAKQWRLPQSRIVIVAGQRDRRKTVRIDGDPEDLLRHLSQWSLGIR